VTASPEWQDCITSLVQSPGLTVVVGASDTGKTTFCTQLLNAAVEAGLKAALVDADIGQSEVGPPGTIALAELTSPVERLSDLAARRMYFVGATSPVGNMLQCVVGAKRMADQAAAHGAELIVVDTTGLVRGVIARKLKTYKIDLLSPAHVVVIQREQEAAPLVAALSKVDKYTIHCVAAPAVAQIKSPELRAARRRLRFTKHFEGAEAHVIRLDDVSCWGTWLNTGRELPWQRIKAVEKILKTRVLHAEAVGGGFYVVVERAPTASDVKALQETAQVRDITVVVGSAFSNAYVGLMDSRANTLDVGIVQAIDFGQRHMIALSALKSVTPVRVVDFGLMRVRPDGTELAKLRPGEI